MNFDKTKNNIEKAKKIYIVSHVNPDGDALGSSFGLYFGLKKIGMDVNVILNEYSDSFDFLPNLNEHVSKVKEDKYDLLIVTDSSDLDRAVISKEDREKAKKIITIDHHEKSMDSSEEDLIDSEAVATCQIVYELLKYMNVEIDKTIATYLYMGLITDSGNFNYENTRSKDLRIAADLMDYGIDFAYICQKLNNTLKISKFRLIGKSIDNMETYLNGKINYTYATQKILKKLNVNDEDAEGMSNYLNKIEDSEVAIYVREKESGKNKVSLRSRGNVDVSKIAIYFGGGGHKRAAGYTMKESLKKSKKKLIDKVIEEVMNLGENIDE